MDGSDPLKVNKKFCGTRALSPLSVLPALLAVIIGCFVHFTGLCLDHTKCKQLLNVQLKIPLCHMARLDSLGLTFKDVKVAITFGTAAALPSNSNQSRWCFAPFFDSLSKRRSFKASVAAHCAMAYQVVKAIAWAQGMWSKWGLCLENIPCCWLEFANSRPRSEVWQKPEIGSLIGDEPEAHCI